MAVLRVETKLSKYSDPGEPLNPADGPSLTDRMV
jgi:hypothetical protein